jgi:AraC-like DNA-binding protein
MAQPKLQTFGKLPESQKVIAQSIDYDDGAHEIAHVHYRAQFVYAATGIVRVVTPLGLWMLTPGQALLIGSEIEHALHMVGQVSMRTLYIDPDVLAEDFADCRALDVEPLLRESILAMFNPALDDESGEATRGTLLVPLILRLLRMACARASDTRLPLPRHARLRRICERLIEQPANNDTLEAWADRIGASARTVARLFREETGLTFGQWREQLRLSEAMSSLAVGQPLARIAQHLGYADVRTFSVMFRRAFGSTPQQFRKDLGEAGA